MIRLSFETSGTTGEPKRVEHTLEAMEKNAQAFNGAVGLNSSTVMYHCLPRGHMAGFLNTILCPTLAGGRVAFGPTFSAQAAAMFWSNLLDYDANTVWITPTMAAMLLRLNRREARVMLRGTVFCGTAPLPLKVRRQWRETFGIPLQESYGTSEHMLVSVQSRRDAETEHNVGRPLPDVTVEIRDNTEIFVNGSPTGDQGELRDGKLTITGRLKDVLKRGDISISPRLIEDVARMVPEVRDAAVVGFPDDFWGEAIALFVEGGNLPLITLHCRERLLKSHWPDRIEIVEKLPRNEMGKVRTEELRSRITA